MFSTTTRLTFRTMRSVAARGASALTLVATLAVASAGNAVAQEASPTPGPDVPASECTVAGRPLSFLRDLVSQPAPETTPVPVEAVPDGVPVEEQTRAEVTATIRQVVACVNAGDPLRAFALYDDAYLRRIIDPDGILDPEIADEIVLSFATPTAVPPDQQMRLLGIPLMRQMTDGRVAVVIETDGGVNDQVEGSQLDLIVLQRQGGVWKIVDGVQNLSRDEAPVDPTPVATP